MAYEFMIYVSLSNIQLLCGYQSALQNPASCGLCMF